MIISQSGLHLSYRFQGIFMLIQPEWFFIPSKYDSQGTRLKLRHFAALYFIFGVMMVIAVMAFAFELLMPAAKTSPDYAYSGRKNGY